MKQLIFISAVILVLVSGTLAFRQTSEDPGVVVRELPKTTADGIFFVEMKNKTCASESPIHTSYSLTVAETDSNRGEQLPQVFLVMLEDGICASLSPISTTSHNIPAPEPKKMALSMPTPGANGLEPGVWYVQH